MRILGTLTAGAFAASLFAGAAAAQDITLKLHHLLGPKSPAHSQMLVP